MIKIKKMTIIIFNYFNLKKKVMKLAIKNAKDHFYSSKHMRSKRCQIEGGDHTELAISPRSVPHLFGWFIPLFFAPQLASIFLRCQWRTR
jgi:hypothetical protein